MTRIARNRRLICTVTIDTKTHVHFLNLFNAIHAANIAVTGFAGDPFCDMSLMIEENKIGHVVHFDPLKRIPIFNQLVHLLNVRAVGLDHFVTIHANIHTGDRCVARFGDRSMAILAIDFEKSRMFSVTERNGLLRRIACVVPYIIYKI